MKNCIYRIYSKSNGREYIGGTKNPHARKFLHFKSLKENNHHNAKLQSHFDKYGIDDLVFEIIEYDLDVSDLIHVEQFYMDKKKPFFNICKIAGSVLGRKHKDSTKKKISKSLKGRKYSKERCLNISIGRKGKNTRTLSIEHKEKISKANKGRKRGRMSNEQKKKISLSLLGISKNKGKKNRNTPVYQILKGKIINEFESLDIAAKSHDTTRSNICHALRGRTKKAKGYEWKYKKDIASQFEKSVV